MRGKAFMIMTACLLSLAAGPVSDEMGADEIVDRANKAAYYAGSDGKADVSMVITDSQGRTRERQFTILRMDVEEGGEQKFYVYFRKPEDVRAMAYMVWKRPGRDDDRWLYLPALDLVRRIAASDKRSSFVGSDFVYEDVSGRGIDEDAHELADTTEDHYKLKNTPKDPGSVEFSHYFLWIDKETFLPFRAEYFDKNGELYRIVESLEVDTIDGHHTVVRSKVSDLGSGGNTVSEFRDVEYDVGLSEDIFTERFLRRPPRQWIE
jgi:outer membrane lipoprotein-sorting protein